MSGPDPLAILRSIRAIDIARAIGDTTPFPAATSGQAAPLSPANPGQSQPPVPTATMQQNRAETGAQKTPASPLPGSGLLSGSSAHMPPVSTQTISAQTQIEPQQPISAPNITVHTALASYAAPPVAHSPVDAPARFGHAQTPQNVTPVADAAHRPAVPIGKAGQSLIALEQPKAWQIRLTVGSAQSYILAAPMPVVAALQSPAAEQAALPLPQARPSPLQPSALPAAASANLLGTATTQAAIQFSAPATAAPSGVVQAPMANASDQAETKRLAGAGQMATDETKEGRESKVSEPARLPGLPSTTHARLQPSVADGVFLSAHAFSVAKEARPAITPERASNDLRQSGQTSPPAQAAPNPDAKTLRQSVPGSGLQAATPSATTVTRGSEAATLINPSSSASASVAPGTNRNAVHGYAAGRGAPSALPTPTSVQSALTPTLRAPAAELVGPGLSSAAPSSRAVETGGSTVHGQAVPARLETAAAGLPLSEVQPAISNTRQADEGFVPRHTPANALQSAAMLLAAGAAQMSALPIESRSTASLLIYNAAMLPGWPYPTAFAQDSAPAARAALKNAASALAGMSQEEIADYLARMGVQQRLRQRLRHALRKLEGLDSATARGFLAAMLDAFEVLMTGLAVAAEEHAQRIALRLDLPDGDDLPPSPDGPISQRRRLRL